ncbi:hypothetical protein G0U57_019649 [Chelydra serpentina]|uniref:Uncharacterized protein n=1 Tax=Chelydra serpentina TaxID=8475 RepID=A0A8T1S4R7_CHESE|nr:hypothetical protein G0U57_019649 [Chelydra serpentina]
MRESPLEMCAGAARVRRGGRALGGAPGSQSTTAAARAPLLSPAQSAATSRNGRCSPPRREHGSFLPPFVCAPGARSAMTAVGDGGGRRASKRGPSARRAGRLRPQPPGAPHTVAGRSPRLGNPRRGLGGGRKGQRGKFLRSAPPPCLPPAPRVRRSSAMFQRAQLRLARRRHGPAPRPQPRWGAPRPAALRR